MRIGFLTTTNTNIGDDFIRQGIENIISSVKATSEIRYTYVNKHYPETAILPNSPLHLLKRLPNLKGKRHLLRAYDKFLYHFYSVYRKQDLVVQSGAPVLWPKCYDNEWANPIWYKTLSRLKDKVPIINLAAGSCYPWETKHGFTNDQEAAYAKDIGSFCRLTTTRDKLAHRLFHSVGVSNTLLPCTAFFTDDQFGNSRKGEYILINYMEGAGHYDWGQKIDKSAWETTLKLCMKELSKEHEIRFICHSNSEADLAKKLVPGIRCHVPTTINEYLDVIRNAKLGINNRMHASVAMASVGVPAISVCTDTRLLMLENLGMPIYYVKEAGVEVLLQDAEGLLNGFSQERERLFELKKIKFEEYKELISVFIK